MTMLPVSAAIVPAGIMPRTAVVTVVTAIVAVVAMIAVAVIRPAARSNVNHRRPVARHRWRAVHHRRRITRGIPDMMAKGNAKGDCKRRTRLRRGGEPSHYGDDYQTEEIFCFHARFDGSLVGFFSWRNNRKVPVCEPVSGKEMEIE